MEFSKKERWLAGVIFSVIWGIYVGTPLGLAPTQLGGDANFLGATILVCSLCIFMIIWLLFIRKEDYEE